MKNWYQQVTKMNVMSCMSWHLLNWRPKDWIGLFSAVNLRVRLHDTATASVPWTAFLPWEKMGTEPNEHGTPSMVLTPLTATAPTLSCVNTSIGNNATHFEARQIYSAVPCRVNDVKCIWKRLAWDMTISNLINFKFYYLGGDVRAKSGMYSMYYIPVYQCSKSYSCYFTRFIITFAFLENILQNDRKKVW